MQLYARSLNITKTARGRNVNSGSQIPRNEGMDTKSVRLATVRNVFR